ncbi:hypothetical protein COCC4DRAFT_186441 [Bipolaris maydis ATCC 48331]|uniref:Uncharacterized protein n=2 Tax=Cochliobolus heterostrophus TaxID=5016 RepID=M2US23_COCH5|nr:uncharacterized protein COCC4DRAFT_186441 [Bipolaris maydis ATCC 48331]EMD90697.1 hypothetical protein COCHEDRAFT_1022489 [Bipolaris maydis C5]ENI09092.1 hypothetical protein COCC4DRAFT_186441 [Bipolaris maydis ATCC 48331]KAH7555618.1 hypothetical protein BM1_07241 [Bipolaris maydis]
MAPNTDICTRALIVTLKSPFGGKSTNQISEITGISPRTIDSIYGRACQRGFEPNAPTIKLLPEYLEDAPRAGRPRKQEDIHETTLEKYSRLQRFIRYRIESPQSSGLQQDEADAQAWVDTEDETGEA